MRRNLNKIFWGLIFISFNINIPIDIIPDIIGYFLIFNGLNKIVGDSEIEESIKEAFSKGVAPALIMIGVEVVEIVMAMNQNHLDTTYNHIYIAIISIVSIAHIVLIFSIINGMYEIAKISQAHGIMEKIKHAFYTYGVLWLLSAVIRPLTLNINRVYDTLTMDGILIIVSIVLFISQIYIIMKVRVFRNAY